MLKVEEKLVVIFHISWFIFEAQFCSGTLLFKSLRVRKIFLEEINTFIQHGHIQFLKSEDTKIM